MKRRPPAPGSGRALLLFAVFFTNLLSLACQVLWSRKIAFLFGSTAAVFSTVLSIFLLGLALGALVAGRVADRHRRPWRLLAALELGLGVYCFFSLAVFDLARGLYLAVFPADLAPLPAAAAKFVVVLGAMIVPTFAIGAAFSVAVRLASTELGRWGRDVSVVYGLDTLGAALGALLAGFVLVPAFGLALSTRLLGVGAVAVGVLLLRRGEPASKKVKRKEREKTKDAGVPDVEGVAGPRLGVVLATFFLTGCAALLLETGWIRFFSLLNGTHVYSSSTVLASFLAGIGLGSLAVARRVDRLRDACAAAALLFAATALGGVAVFRSAPLFERAYFAIFARFDGYYGFQLTVCLVIAGLVVLPTLAMGANFPVVARIATRASAERGFAVGRVYFVNTLGAVLGAFLAEFVVLPAWGFAGLMGVTLVLYGLACAVFLALARPPGRWRIAAACAVLIAAAAALSPPVLRLELPFHALYYHGLRGGSWQSYREEVRGMTVIEQRQSFYGQVAVVDLGGRHLLLKHNGKTDASTALQDNRTQILLGHLPLLFHPDPRRVLAIGLGGAFTLRALTAYAEPREITMVEIDPEVVAAARRHFSDHARGALDDPRVRLVTNDGRNFMDRSPELFDVITSEPPNIWVAGVSGLFTVEFYRSAAAHLGEGGLLCQWVPLYEMKEDDFQTMVRTVTSVFPHVTFWQIGTDVAILASESPLAPSLEQVRARLRQPRVARDLAEIGLGEDETLTLLNSPAARPDQVPGYLGQGGVLNTDDRPVLELSTARNLFELAKEP
jgi:predicted membrane-bound spermidine synthase